MNTPMLLQYSGMDKLQVVVSLRASVQNTQVQNDGQMCDRSGNQAMGHDPERLMLRTPSLAPFTALALSFSSFSLTAVGKR